MVWISNSLNGSEVRREPTALSQSPSRGTFYLRKNSSSHRRSGEIGEQWIWHGMNTQLS